MLNYVLKRIGISLLTVFFITTLTYFLMYSLPGKPFLGDRDLPASVIAAVNSKYGLDLPMHLRYLKYLSNVIKGDFGTSTVYTNRDITSIIVQAFPVSASLGLRALVFGVIGGLLFGIYSALHHNKLGDRLSTVAAIIGVSIPSFILGTMLQYLLGVKFSGWIKVMFNTKYQLFPLARWESFRYTLIPTFVLGLGSLASVMRMMRSSMLDVVNQDYIKTAKAKGLSSNEITWKHMLRNAITPVYTVIGGMVGVVVTGSFVIENIFSIPGLGKYFVNSVTSNDYSMTIGLTLFFSIFIVFVNLIVDLGYGLIDPRVRLERKAR
ncbi:MAG: ABC transporter permease [Oscillospiraceae bacterium]|jgi:oligopeptide transport system permease protein|nr:ABC transporter permease [Oscillospiraceae bacterium]